MMESRATCGRQERDDRSRHRGRCRRRARSGAHRGAVSYTTSRPKSSGKGRGAARPVLVLTRSTAPRISPRPIFCASVALELTASPKSRLYDPSRKEPSRRREAGAFSTAAHSRIGCRDARGRDAGHGFPHDVTNAWRSSVCLKFVVARAAVRRPGSAAIDLVMWLRDGWTRSGKAI